MSERTAASESIHMAVWGLAGPIVAGETFEIVIGAKLTHGASMAGNAVTILDGNGIEIGRTALGSTFWDGTNLHWAKIALVAPDPGLHHWSANIIAGANRKSAAFTFVSVGARAHRAEVTVTEAGSKAPVPDAHVRVGPYSGRTDEAGMASLLVTAGDYEVAAWKTTFVASAVQAKVEADLRVSIALEPMVDRDPQYVAKDADFVWT